MEWRIEPKGLLFVLFSPSGQKKGEFTSMEEAKEAMERIRSLKKLSNLESHPELKKEEPFFGENK